MKTLMIFSVLIVLGGCASSGRQQANNEVYYSDFFRDFYTKQCKNKYEESDSFCKCLVDQLDINVPSKALWMAKEVAVTETMVESAKMYCAERS